MKICIYGGGFNPPHKAHVMAVADALASGEFAKLWVIPCFHHAFEKDSDLISFDHRLEMCKLAFAQWEGTGKVHVLDVEREFQTRYTYDLVTKLQEKYPGREFYLMIGSDNLEDYQRWHRFEDLEKLVKFFILPRPKSVGTHYIWHMPNISSTQIRAWIKEHNTLSWTNVEDTVPKPVVEYIKKHGLWMKEDSDAGDKNL